VVKLVWTDRKDIPHVISCQYAVKRDVKLYFQRAV
jgi:hypothetical protein